MVGWYCFSTSLWWLGAFHCIHYLMGGYIFLHIVSGRYRIFLSTICVILSCFLSIFISLVVGCFFPSQCFLVGGFFSLLCDIRYYRSVIGCCYDWLHRFLVNPSSYGNTHALCINIDNLPITSSEYIYLIEIFLHCSKLSNMN